MGGGAGFPAARPASSQERRQTWGNLLQQRLGNPPSADVVTFGALINRFLKEAMPERKGTADLYQSWILNYINARWEQVPLSKVKPLAVEMRLKGLNLAPKSKSHVRSVMHILFEWAMRWELMEYNRNPMSLLKLKGVTKPVRQARSLSVEELQSLWAHLDEDTRTMSMVDVCPAVKVPQCFLRGRGRPGDFLRIYFTISIFGQRIYNPETGLSLPA